MAVDAPGVRRRNDSAELAGLDALDLPGLTPHSRLSSFWRATWPKLAAIGLVVLGWQLTVMSGWKPDYVLPGPWTVAQELWGQAGTGSFWRAIATTMRRGLTGFVLAMAVGLAIGVAVARSACSARRSAP